VTDLIDAVPAATAFLINWRVFGHSGREHWQPGFVTERFTRSSHLSDGVNLPFKTLFSKADAYRCRLLPHQPRYPRHDRLSELVYVSGGGDVLPAYFHDESRDSFLQSNPGEVSWRLAQVNHYNTRSWEDYLVKHHRGGGLDIPWEREACWTQFNRNEEEDRSILAKLPGARQIFEAMIADPQVRACHERCCALYAAHIARLRDGLAATGAAG
jgi:hypothetical protein